MQSLGFQTKSCKCWGSRNGTIESTLEVPHPRKDDFVPENRSVIWGPGHLHSVRSRPRNPFQFLESILRSEQGLFRPCGKIEVGGVRAATF